MPYLLGIDIGTSSTKALICDDRGRVRGTASSPHSLSSPKPGWSEQDPLQWWSATCKATKAALKKAKLKKKAVAAIGLSGQMHGSVFLADGEKPLRPAILWNDQRTAAECAAIEKAAGGRRKLIQMVGNPALTGFTAPKILWLRKHEPKAFKKTRHVLLPKDYIRLRMTGEYATEVSDASGTLLLDVRKRKWNRKLLDLLKLDPALMPPCYESHVVTGQLHSAAANALGLAKGTPVVGGGGDQAAGAVGNGIVSKGIVSATLGTSGVVFAHSELPVYDKQGRVHTMCSAVDGKWCVFGCMLCAAGCLQWFHDTLAPGSDFDELVAEAGKAAPGGEGLFFLPYLTGERCPYPDPEARGGWVGLTTRHDRPAMIRALLEGATFGMQDQLKIFAGMGIDVRKIYLSGGGAKSRFWRQLQADIYGKTVAVTHTDEGPAYGVALLAGVGIGVWPSVPAACKKTIRETESRKPDARNKRFYRKHHAEYQRLYPALADEFPRMAV